MTNKLSAVGLFCAALVALVVIPPQPVQATPVAEIIISKTLSQLPVTQTIPEPPDETTLEPTVFITITNARWPSSFTFEAFEGATSDQPEGTLSDIISLFNNALGQATICGESDPIPATPVCPQVGPITAADEGDAEPLLAASFPAQNLTTGGTVQILIEVCGGGNSCAAAGFGAGLSDAIRVSVVPEPGTLLLLGSGLAGLAGLIWRRHRRK